VALAMHHRLPADEVTSMQVHGLLRTLIEVFETMRQCESDGFVACTLKSASLGEAKRKELLLSYQQRISALHDRVATHAMALVLRKHAARTDELGLLGASSSVPLQRHAVHLTHVCAEDLPDDLSSHVSIRFALLDLPGDATSEGRTLEVGRSGAGPEPKQASWTDELVSLALPGSEGAASELARPLKLRVQLWEDDESTLLGTTISTLEESVGCIRVPLLVTMPPSDSREGTEETTAETTPTPASAAARVSFSFRVSPWLED